MHEPHTTQQKNIYLCADDYSLSADIDNAILNLLKTRRINATSCLSSSPRWLQQSAPRLREIGTERASQKIHCGLHLNLTEGFGQPALSLNTVLLYSYARAWNKPVLITSIQQQLDTFEQGLQSPPDFIDGHQHIHQFPQIREVLLELLTQRYHLQGHSIWLRSTCPPKHLKPLSLKPYILSLLGGHHFHQQCQHLGFNTNQGFLGVYNFKGDYARHFQHWLNQVQGNELIMCHPSARLNDSDCIGLARFKEYQFFTASTFTELLQSLGISLY